jgi:hypothetical protein
MAIAIISGCTAGMVFRAVQRFFLRLHAWATSGLPLRVGPRPGNPEPAWEADPRAWQDTLLPAGVSLSAVYARNDHARRVVAGFAAEMPTLSGPWQQVDQALADVPHLGAACSRVISELIATRASRAKLVAAMRAALAAQAEGEADPLFYLRYELGGQQAVPRSRGCDHDDAY